MREILRERYKERDNDERENMIEENILKTYRPVKVIEMSINEENTPYSHLFFVVDFLSFSFSLSFSF